MVPDGRENTGGGGESGVDGGAEDERCLEKEAGGAFKYEVVIE